MARFVISFNKVFAAVSAIAEADTPEEAAEIAAYKINSWIEDLSDYEHEVYVSVAFNEDQYEAEEI